jgi:hypothetical protein
MEGQSVYKVKSIWMLYRSNGTRTLRGKLSHPSFQQACNLLGSRGQALIMEGGKFEINLDQQVALDDNHFCLTLEKAVVKICLNNAKRRRFDMCCGLCSGPCVHQGAALSLILEEKLFLGLSAPPRERAPMESLDEEALVDHAVAERRQRAREEKMRLKSMDPRRLWTDYVITNLLSGKTYRLAELYSVVEFIDDRRLGPAFRFFNRHRVVDEKGKLLGYKNLDQLRER